MGTRHADTDKDGLSDYDEDLYKTDSNNPDTDGDGYSDGDEVKNGYNPLGSGEITPVSDTPSSKEIEEIETLFADYVSAAKAGDATKVASFIYYYGTPLPYYGTSLSNDIPAESKQYIADELTSAYEGLTYTIKDIEINENQAVLTISAMKNGRQKEDKKTYLINYNGSWKINSFGLNHPADAENIADSSACDSLCVEKGFYSGSWYNPSESTDCYCYHDPPQTEDLNYLNIDKCETKAKEQQWSCYLQYAENYPDEEYCKKLTGGTKQNCYENVAEQKNDITVCDNLWDDRSCLSKIDPSQPVKYTGVTSTDQNLITELQDYCDLNDTACITGFATYNNDSSLCDNITETQSKTLCNNYFSTGQFMMRRHYSNTDTSYLVMEISTNSFQAECEQLCKNDNMTFRDYGQALQQNLPGSIAGYQKTFQHDATTGMVFDYWGACYCY